MPFLLAESPRGIRGWRVGYEPSAIVFLQLSDRLVSQLLLSADDIKNIPACNMIDLSEEWQHMFSWKLIFLVAAKIIRMSKNCIPSPVESSILNLKLRPALERGCNVDLTDANDEVVVNMP